MSQKPIQEQPRYTFGLVDPTGQLLHEIGDKRMTRDDVAATYALAMNTPDEVDWPKVNHAILDRWSRSALVYIKQRAWKVRAR